jgi:hypothetical protein
MKPFMPFSRVLLLALAFVILSGCTQETVLQVAAPTETLESAAGSQTLLNITANRAWTASSNVSWLNISPSTGSAGTVSVQGTYSENPEVASRVATITVTCQDVTQQYKFTQVGSGIDILQENVTFLSSSGSTQTVTINASDSWTVTVSDTKQTVSWLSVSPTSGTAGKCDVKITVTQNNTEFDERNAYLIFKVGAKSKTMTVTQKQLNAIILQKDRIEMGPAGGSFSLAVQSNVDYSVVIPSESNWISRTTTKGLTTSTETFSVSPGSEEGSREGLVIFKSASSGISDTLTVFQGQFDRLFLDGDTLDVVSAGGIVEVNVRANIQYQATLIGASDWLKIVQTKAMREDKIYLQASPNDTYSERTAVLRLSGGTVSDDIVIRQFQNNSLSLSVHSVQLSVSGGTFDVEVSSNVKYSWRILGDVQWLRNVAAKSLSKDNYTFEAYENTGYADRSARIIFKADDLSVADTLVVNQAKLRFLSVDPKAADLPASGGTVDVYVQGNVAYVTSIIAGSEWIHEVATKVIAEDHRCYAVDANPNFMPREGIVAFCSTDGSGLADTLKITQSKSLSFEMTSSSAVSIAAAGGNFNSTISTNDDYSVSVPLDAGWITIGRRSSSGTTFTQPVSVASNTSIKPRSAIITFICVGDSSKKATVAVNQSGADIFLVRMSASPVALPAEGGTANVILSSNDSYAVEIPSDASWLSAGASTLSGTEYTQPLIAAANASFVSRSVVVTFRSVSNSALTASVTVNQSATGVSFALTSADAVAMAASGGNFTANISTNSDFTLSIPIEADWIAAGLKSKTGTSFTQAISVAANASIAERSATVSFICLADPSMKASITITQSGADVYLDRTSSADITLAAEGGTSSVTLSSNDSYVMEIPSDASWLSAGAATHSGNEYSQPLTAAVNKAISQRSAVVTFRSASKPSLATSVTVRQLAASAYITIGSVTPAMVASAGGDVMVALSSNDDYSLEIPSSASSWLTAGSKTQVGGDFTQKFTAMTNNETSSRSAEVVFRSVTTSSVTAIATITQSGAGIEFSLASPAAVDIVAAGGSFVSSIATNSDYTISMPIDADWITPGTKVHDGASFSQAFTVAANASISSRSAVITFICTSDQSKTAAVTVIQSGASVFLTLTSESAVSVSSVGGSIDAVISTNSDFTVSIPEGATWLSVQGKTQTGTTFIQSISIAANTSVTERSATITFVCSADASKTVTVAVTQSGADIYLTRTSSSPVSIAAAGGTVYVTLSSNDSYAVEIPASASWLSAGTATHSGTGYIQPLTAVANTSSSSRSAVVTFRSVLSPAVTATVEIDQAGIEQTMSVSPSTASVAATSGSTAVTVTASGSYTASYSAGWITVGDGSSLGSSRYSHSISYTANTSVAPRSATVTFTLDANSAKTATYTITQSGADVTISVTSTPSTVASTGGSVDVGVSTNDDYTVSSSASWITAGTRTANGSNSYIQSLTIASNSSSSSRSATVTFRSTTNTSKFATVTVTQAGGYYVTLNPSSTTVAATATSTTFDVSFNFSNLGVRLASGSFITDFKLASGVATITFTANASYTPRTTSIDFMVNGTSTVLATFTLTQAAAEYVGVGEHDDGGYKKIQTHKAGSGIPIVIMGDGFTQSQISASSGGFDYIAEHAMDYFFAVEPYSTYRDYFDVYRVSVVAASSGISSNGSTNPLHTYIPNPGGSTSVTTNDDFNAVETYVNKVPGITFVGGDLLVIVIMNSSIYAGTTMMSSNGTCVAMCPIIGNDANTSYQRVLQHEAGGHGFGLLADEYGGNGTISPSEKSEYQNWQSYGFYQNIDFTDIPTDVLWASFLSNSAYSGQGLGVFVGGGTYDLGVWRPTDDSMMRHNTGVFNAPCREQIYKHIMERSGGSYSHTGFLSYDTKNLSTAPASSKTPSAISAGFKPFAPPIMVKTGTWRRQ